MQTPIYTRYEYVDATAFSTAAAQATANTMLLAVSSLRPGLIHPEAATLAGSGLTLNALLPAPFAVVSASGAVIGAHGVNTNQDTQSYAVSLSGFVPGSGSATVYVLASGVTIQQSPYTVVGPPVGHPNYDANFVPTTAYATSLDSLTLYASGGPADNAATFEICRTTLSAGATGITSIDKTHQYFATPYPFENTVSVSSNKTLADTDAGIIQRIDAANVFITLPDAGVAINLEFIITARAAAGTLQISTAGNLIYGSAAAPGTGATSVVIPLGGSVAVQSDGTAFQLTSNVGNSGLSQIATLNISGSGSVVLTTANAASPQIALIGTLTGNVTLVFPASNVGLYAINSAVSGAFSVTASISGSAGTTQAIALGRQILWFDGTNVSIASANSVTQTAGNATTLNATTAFIGTAISNLNLGTASTYAYTAFDPAGAAASAYSSAAGYTNTTVANYLPLAGGNLTGQLQVSSWSGLITAGRISLGANATSGAIIGGNGSSTDFIILNKNGNAVLYNATGSSVPIAGASPAAGDNSTALTTTNWVRTYADPAGAADSAQSNAEAYARSGGVATTSLGFTPVQQGGGARQAGNKIFIGWTGATVAVQVDSTDEGDLAFESWVEAYAQPILGFQPVTQGGGDTIGIYNAGTANLYWTRNGTYAGMLWTNSNLTAVSQLTNDAAYVTAAGAVGATLSQISSLGAIGSTYLFGSYNNYVGGTNYAGSEFGASGTWLCLNSAVGSSAQGNFVSLFIRIA